MAGSAPLRLAVFDCDGTLVDGQHMIHAAMAAAWAAEALDVAPTIEAVRRVVGLELVTAIAMLLPDGDAPRHARMAEAYKAAFFAARQQGGVDPLFPGCREALAALERDGWLLGVATGKARRGLDAVLALHDLAGHFVTRQTASDAPGKPHPGMLERAMAETGVGPGETVMIGDTTYDMEMAGNAGVPAIGVAWGYHAPEELRAAGARRVVADFPDLVSLLADGIPS